jgi:hypothetical protein
MKEIYKDVYGTWIVKTEGDVEGRSMRTLGTFTGYVDEIALHLADKCLYSLTFEKLQPVSEYIPKKGEVNVQFDIESGTWENLDINEIKNAFSNRPVEITNSNYFASFKIISTKNSDIVKQSALNKLTEEEKQALGLI